MEKTLTIIYICLILAGVSNILQTIKISHQEKRIDCLEQGLVYVGDQWCAELLQTKE